MNSTCFLSLNPQPKRGVRSQHPLGCALLRSATCHASRFSKGVPTALRTTPEPQAAMVQPQTSWARDPGTQGPRELGDAVKNRGFIWDMVGIWWGYGGDVVGIWWGIWWGCHGTIMNVSQYSHYIEDWCGDRPLIPRGVLWDILQEWEWNGKRRTKPTILRGCIRCPSLIVCWFMLLPRTSILS